MSSAGRAGCPSHAQRTLLLSDCAIQPPAGAAAEIQVTSSLLSPRSQAVNQPQNYQHPASASRWGP